MGKVIKLGKAKNIKSSDIRELKIDDLQNQDFNFIKELKNKQTSKYSKDRNSLLDLIIWGPTLIDIVSKIKEIGGKQFEVIFSSDILEKINNGDYSLVKDKLGDIIAQVRNNNTGELVKNLRLKELTSVEKLYELSGSLQNMAMMAAMQKISSQLANIEEKLNNITEEFSIDRRGEIQSGYNLYLQALKINKIERREGLLLHSIAQLSNGRSKLIEEARKKLEQLTEFKADYWSEFKKELISHNHHEKKETVIKSFATDLFFIQRSTQVITEIYFEMNEPLAALEAVEQYKYLINHITSNHVLLHNFSEYDLNSNWKSQFAGIQDSLNSLPTSKELSNSDFLLEVNVSEMVS